MTRTLALLLTTLAALATAPAASAQIPGFAGGKPPTFVAQWKATVVTKWEEPAYRQEGCYSVTDGFAEGSQRTTIKTIPTRVRVIRAGRDASVGYGPLRRPVNGLPGKGTIKAEHWISKKFSPGLCAGPDDQVPEEVDDQHQCEDPMRWKVQFVSVNGRFGPIAIEEETPEAQDACTIYKPDEASYVWRRSGIRVPWKQLTDRNREFVVLRGGRTIREAEELDKASAHLRIMSTSVKWTLRLRRAK